MLDIASLNAATGKKGINLGSSGSNFAENYILLKRFYSKRNVLRTLFIQVDVYGLNSCISYSRPVNEQFYIAQLGDPDVNEMFFDYLNPIKVMMWKYVPFSKYAEFNKRYALQNLFSKPEQRQVFIDSSFGSYILPDSVIKHPRKPQIKHYRIEPADLKWFKRLVDLAQHQETRVILFTAPVNARIFPYEENESSVMNAYLQFAAERHLDYFDFRDIPISHSDSLFRDYTHLNAIGSLRFSMILGSRIKESGALDGPERLPVSH
jgi:hypothetical protein